MEPDIPISLRKCPLRKVLNEMVINTLPEVPEFLKQNKTDLIQMYYITIINIRYKHSGLGSEWDDVCVYINI